MFDSVTAAEDNMKSKLSEKVFDSVTAAEDNMKSKLPGVQNTQQNSLTRLLLNLTIAKK